MMEYAKYRIIKESVKFLNGCQRNASEGKINADCYRQLTGRKLIFLNEMLKEEERSMLIDSAMKASVGRLLLMKT